MRSDSRLRCMSSEIMMLCSCGYICQDEGQGQCSGYIGVLEGQRSGSGLIWDSLWLEFGFGSGSGFGFGFGFGSGLGSGLGFEFDGVVPRSPPNRGACRCSGGAGG